MHVLCSVCVDLLYDRDIILHRVRTAQEGFHSKHKTSTLHTGNTVPGRLHSKHLAIILHRVCTTQAITVHRENTASGDFTSNTRIPYYTAHGDPTPNTGNYTTQGDSTINTGLFIVHSTAGHPIQGQGYHVTQHRGNFTPNTWQSYYTALEGFHSKHRTTILHRDSITQGGSTPYRAITVHRDNTVSGDFIPKTGVSYYTAHEGSHSKHGGLTLHRGNTGQDRETPLQTQCYHIT